MGIDKKILVAVSLVVILFIILLVCNPYLVQLQCNAYCGYYGGFLERFDKTCQGNPTCIYDLCIDSGGKIVKDLFGNPYCCLCIT